MRASIAPSRGLAEETQVLKRLSKREFMHFVVALPEAGNVDEMQEMLDTHPEHEHELLFGERSGVDQGKYSVWAYSTWLCNFDAHREDARNVVKWLLTQRHKPDLWSAIALDDVEGLRKILGVNSSLSQAKHPLFGDTALELASQKLRPLLLHHGADDGSIFTALLLGDTDRARKMISETPSLISDPANGPKVLLAALTNRHDGFACELIEQGVNLSGEEEDYSLLSMAATWGNPRATKALIAAGADPNLRVGIFTPLSMCISRSVASPKVVAEVVANLLDGGAEVRRTRIEGLTLQQWCKKKGFDEAGELIRRASA